MDCMAWRRDSAALAKSAASRRAISARRAASLAEARLEFWPASCGASGAAGASCSITALEPAPLAPSESPSDVPPRMPPEPEVEADTLAGAKYSAMPRFCSGSVVLISHISRKKAIMAVTKSA